ncbi:hypothetical protein LIA77_08393 [Sarocladium implicatum]|nr:hypothetical protein LIA77_08393 [Sarocladium implicatum]
MLAFVVPLLSIRLSSEQDSIDGMRIHSLSWALQEPCQSVLAPRSHSGARLHTSVTFWQTPKAHELNAASIACEHGLHHPAIRSQSHVKVPSTCRSQPKT